MVARDSGSFDRQHAVLDDIVSLGKAMGLEVDSDDVEELVEYHKSELTTEELQDPHREQQEMLEEISSEEEDSKGNISTAEINPALVPGVNMTLGFFDRLNIPNFKIISFHLALYFLCRFLSTVSIHLILISMLPFM